MEHARTSPAGKASVSSLGLPAPQGSARAAGPHEPTIEELTRAVEQEARKRPEVQRLVTHPGVGLLTALAFMLIIGISERFPCGKQLGSYVGLIPEKDLCT